MNMSQLINAVYENGVLKPEQPLDLPSGALVRVFVEPLDEQAKRQKAWDDLQRLHKEHPINSGGDRLTRDQLHERR
jgi:predicted DNA-binding antitoxin AbrB/MazE fold protein